MTPARRLLGLRVLLFSACLTPALHLVWRAWQGQLGANPVETLEHASGLWGLRLLMVTLMMSPLRRWTGRVEFVQLRRMLGLFCFFYVTVHLSVFLVFDLSLSVTALVEEVVKRPYVTVGFSAWCLLLPLALTSTTAWQRRLKRRWKQLHQLVYPALVLACLHFLWLVKADLLEPLIYTAIAIALLALRWPRTRAGT